MSNKVTEELHSLVTSLEAEGHALAAKARGILARLKGDEEQLAADAHTAETQIAQGAAPVVAEAETDAKKLAGEATSDVKTVAS